MGKPQPDRRISRPRKLLFQFGAAIDLRGGRLLRSSSRVMATPIAGPVLFVFALVAVSLAAQTPPAADNLPDPKLSEVWTPVPPVISAPAGGIPSDAIVLFDGRNLDAWESAETSGQPAPWKLEDGILICSPKTGYIRTKASFGDIQLHLEFREPAVGRGRRPGPRQQRRLFHGAVRDPGPRLLQQSDLCRRLGRRDLRPAPPAGECLPPARRVADLRHHFNPPLSARRKW